MPSQTSAAKDWSADAQHAKRAGWKSGAAFVTPPGLWHSHHNESSGDAYLLPVQGAGLHTYLRTLNIQFFHPEHKSYISQYRVDGRRKTVDGGKVAGCDERSESHGS